VILSYTIRANTPSDITINSSSPGDPLLVDIACLVLEVSLNGKVVDKIVLVSKEASPGVWNTDQALAM
jgi:hypothetical protein